MSTKQAINPNNNHSSHQSGTTSSASGKKGKQEIASQYNTKSMKPKIEKGLLEYAKRLVDPLESELGLSPSPVPCRMVAIRDKIVIDLKEHLSDTGDWYVEVRPTLTDTVTLTQGTDPVIGSGSNLVFTAVTFISNAVNGGTLTYSNSKRTSADFLSDDSTTCGGGFLLNDSGAAKVYGITWDPITYTGDVSGTLEVYSSGALTTLGETAAVFSVAVTQATTGLLPGTFTLPANAKYLGFRFVTVQPASVIANFTLMHNSGGGNFVIGNAISSFTTLDTEFSSANVDYDRYRITAQDVLITYMGSDYANGGVIASARVPDTWSPSADYYDAITQLPYDSYNGPLKVGTHVHWLPASVDELTPKLVFQTPDVVNKLIVYGRQDDLVNKQSVRMMVTTIIEFYSDVPIYGAMKFCAPPTNVGLLIYWLGMHVPAATSNDGHLDKLKKFLPTALSKGLQYGLDNPEVISKMLKVAMGLFL